MESTIKETLKMTASMEKEHCFMDKIDPPTQVIGPATSSTEKDLFTMNFLHQAILPSITVTSTKSKNPG